MNESENMRMVFGMFLLFYDAESFNHHGLFT